MIGAHLYLSGTVRASSSIHYLWLYSAPQAKSASAPPLGADIKLLFDGNRIKPSPRTDKSFKAYTKNRNQHSRYFLGDTRHRPNRCPCTLLEIQNVYCHLKRPYLFKTVLTSGPTRQQKKTFLTVKGLALSCGHVRNIWMNVDYSHFF